jgi:SIR2-like domain
LIPDLSATRIAEELLKAVSGGDCIAWVGSGLSAVAYRGWNDAIAELCDACGISRLAKYPSADELIDKAEECKKADQRAYEETLANLYGGNVTVTRLAYQWLMRAPFKAYVTTNFDPLLSESAAVAGHANVFRYPLLELPEIGRRTKPMFYIHGHARPNGIASGQNLVLARSEFKEAYGGVVSLFLQAIFLSYPIVFIGCGLSEPEIQEQMSRVHSMLVQIKRSRVGYKSPVRFALLPPIMVGGDRKDDQELVEAERFEELDTTVLRYSPADPAKHWEIEDILKSLCDVTPMVGPSGPGLVSL